MWDLSGSKSEKTTSPFSLFSVKSFANGSDLSLKKIKKKKRSKNNSVQITRSQIRSVFLWRLSPRCPRSRLRP